MDSPIAENPADAPRAAAGWAAYCEWAREFARRDSSRSSEPGDRRAQENLANRK
jgi:hypothetical protein